VHFIVSDYMQHISFLVVYRKWAIMYPMDIDFAFISRNMPLDFWKCSDLVVFFVFVFNFISIPLSNIDFLTENKWTKSLKLLR
jgi:hypothetical protein